MSVLQQPVLPLDVAVLQQHLLPSGVSLRQQHVLLLDVSVLQQPVLPLACLFYCSLCSLVSATSCFTEGHTPPYLLQRTPPKQYSSPTASGVSVLQQPVLPLSCFFCSSLCCFWRAYSTAALCCLLRVCSTAACVPLEYLFYSSLCCHWRVCSTVSSLCCLWRV
jgi:hypothetical protein